MQFFKNILESDRTALAGFIGSLAGLLFLTEVKTTRQKISLLLLGTCLAYYFAEPVAGMLHLGGPKGIPAAGFAVGLLGYAFLQSVFRSLKELDITELLTSAISTFFSRIGRK